MKNKILSVFLLYMAALFFAKANPSAALTNVPKNVGPFSMISASFLCNGSKMKVQLVWGNSENATSYDIRQEIRNPKSGSTFSYFTNVHAAKSGINNTFTVEIMGDNALCNNTSSFVYTLTAFNSTHTSSLSSTNSKSVIPQPCVDASKTFNIIITNNCLKVNTLSIPSIAWGDITNACSYRILRDGVAKKTISSDAINLWADADNTRTAKNYIYQVIANAHNKRLSVEKTYKPHKCLAVSNNAISQENILTNQPLNNSRVAVPVLGNFKILSVTQMGKYCSASGSDRINTLVKWEACPGANRYSVYFNGKLAALHGFDTGYTSKTEALLNTKNIIGILPANSSVYVKAFFVDDTFTVKESKNSDIKTFPIKSCVGPFHASFDIDCDDKQNQRISISLSSLSEYASYYNVFFRNKLLTVIKPTAAEIKKGSLSKTVVLGTTPANFSCNPPIEGINIVAQANGSFPDFRESVVILENCNNIPPFHLSQSSLTCGTTNASVILKWKKPANTCNQAIMFSNDKVKHVVTTNDCDNNGNCTYKFISKSDNKSLNIFVAAYGTKAWIRSFTGELDSALPWISKKSTESLDITFSKCSANARESIENSIVTQETTKISLFPNPTMGEFSLNMEGLTTNNPIDITLFDLSGKNVFTSQLMPQNESNAKINIAHLPAGTYLVNIGIEGKEYHQKIIKE